MADLSLIPEADWSEVRRLAQIRTTRRLMTNRPPDHHTIDGG